MQAFQTPLWSVAVCETHMAAAGSAQPTLRPKPSEVVMDVLVPGFFFLMAFAEGRVKPSVLHTSAPSVWKRTEARGREKRA